MFQWSKTCHSHTPSMVKLDREPTQAAFDFGRLPKTIGSGESTAHSIAIHLNTCQSFSAVVKSSL
jgi:hypothetical protein